VLLTNNVELSFAISRYVPLLEAVSGEDIVTSGWKYDPPKVLSDVLESVLGAILVDSAYNFEKVESVIEFVLGDILAALSPSLREDPVSDLIKWMARSGCRDISFRWVIRYIPTVAHHLFAFLWKLPRDWNGCRRSRCCRCWSAECHQPHCHKGVCVRTGAGYPQGQNFGQVSIVPVRL
jgi:hypothetical protein